jgi:hypothetical protein
MGKLTPEAERMLILLGKNIIKKFYYTNPDDKFDCYQTAMLTVFKNWHNFDETKSVNAFAYFSEIFKRGAAKGFGELYKRVDGEWLTHMSLDFQDDGGKTITML